MGPQWPLFLLCHPVWAVLTNVYAAATPSPAAHWASAMPTHCPGSFAPRPSLPLAQRQSRGQCVHAGNRPHVPVCGRAQDVCAYLMSLERPGGTHWSRHLHPMTHSYSVCISFLPSTHKIPVAMGVTRGVGAESWGPGPFRKHRGEECPLPGGTLPLLHAAACQRFWVSELGSPGLPESLLSPGWQVADPRCLWLQEDTPSRHSSSGRRRSWWKRDSGDSRTSSRMSRPEVGMDGC